MRNILIALLLMSSFCSVNAQQEAELFHAGYQIAPFKTRNGSLQEFDTKVKFPFLRADYYQVVAGLSYETIWTNTDSLQEFDRVHGLSGQLLFSRIVDQYHSFMFFISGGVYSDFKEVSFEDVRFSGGLRYKTRLRENFGLSLGIVYSQQFFGRMIAPYIDFTWNIGQEITLSGPFPLNTKLSVRVNKKSKLSIFLRPDNATFRLSADEANSHYFQKKQWNFGVGLDYMLTEHWMIAFKTGISIKRQFEVYDSSENGVFSILTIDIKGGERTPIYSYKDNSIFGNVSLVWVIRPSQ